ncbi:MAG: phosphoribosylformylglycinamidine synthase I [Nitrososphaerota archaeon]|nr:phosphoribosylformylglycinamidine synthase I [Nitrososphaerota archaeon]MDG6923354.1 phosphoribosylformylglycinamidine synthase I [Nitrososphaerota archaeon]
MERYKARICVVRVGGSNRDADVVRCLEDQGANVETLHLNDILRRRNLTSYNGLVFPGGFAYGDYVRAGAIWAAKIQALLANDLKMFVDSAKPVLGICNGFQVLVEAGLLPEETLAKPPTVALSNNDSGRFECRWVKLRKNASSNCIFTKELPDVVQFPVAHGEGRFVTQDKTVLESISKNSQIVLQYAGSDGHPARLKYPDNPNGSINDIAGICNPSGTVFGLMPHPENAYWGFEMPDWTESRTIQQYGDGLGIFKSMVDYIEQNL